MTHDDVIGTRRVSYIIYFSDPDPAWEFKDGGMLELYPLAKRDNDQKKQKNKKSKKSKSDADPDVLAGVPAVAPTACLCPAFNTMAMFVVQPGKSYHAVQEVRTDMRPRLSIQGWFHGPTPLEGSDKASLSQIMSYSQKNRATPSPLSEPNTKKLTTMTRPSMTVTELDVAYLRQYVNPMYLQQKTITQINEEFCEQSSIQLGQFLKKDIATRMTELARDADGAFFASTATTQSQEIPRYAETFMNDACWDVRGPPHMQRYSILKEKLALKQKKKVSKKRTELTGLLLLLRENVMKSAAFGRLIKRFTSLLPSQGVVECRRFRPGMDYTLAHYGMLTRESQLDATLCFVDDRQDDLSDQVWESGDVGGFQCYIVADEEEGTEAAEVYQAKSTEEEEAVLSIPPANNTLSFVLRDGGIMQFVKYVSASAPGSRWDVAAVYDLVESEDDEEDKEEGEEEDE